MSDQKRPYRMKRRAELEEQTRLRITESAVALHEELGPARTSISAVAERAGVRRSTVYRHFPDEEALFAACSSHWRAANPPPDPGAWAAIDDPAERTADRAARALRVLRAHRGDVRRACCATSRSSRSSSALLGDFHGYLRVIEDILMAGRGLRGRAARRTRAAIGHALAFSTWRSLAREQGLGDDEAVALMSVLVEGAARAGSASGARRSCLDLGGPELPQPGQRLPTNLRAQHRGPPEREAGRPECLPRPAPEAELVDVLRDQPVREPEPRVDVVDHRAAGLRERVVRDPPRGPAAPLGAVFPAARFAGPRRVR